MTKSSKNFKDIELQANVKAWKDPAFRKKLITHPKETLSELGYKVPEGFKLVIVEEKPMTMTLVLKECPTGSQRLSNSDLEKLAAAYMTEEQTCSTSEYCHSTKDC